MIIIGSESGAARLVCRRQPWTTGGQGQRVALTFTNSTMMWHPMRLHGHTFEVLAAGGRPGARKDTVIVLPMQRLQVRFVADLDRLLDALQQAR